MEYYESVPGGPSKVQLEWTNQHGCGGNEDDNPHKLNCNLVIQYMCQPEAARGPDTIRNGVNPQKNDQKREKGQESETQAQFQARKEKVGSEPCVPLVTRRAVLRFIW